MHSLTCVLVVVCVARKRRPFLSYSKIFLHMSHNCTAQNCFFLRVFRCNAWHVFSEILRPIRRTTWNIVVEWSGRSPINLGVQEVCLPKLVGKTLLMFGSNAPDDCLRFRKRYYFRWLVAVMPSSASRRLWAMAMALTFIYSFRLSTVW